MDIRNNMLPSKFFAAANTYNGFVSFFDEIFDSADYNKIYVLKGGPGTGKSSLMKSIANHFNNEDLRIEFIYCSSDPGSLDSVIISAHDKKIAIIDGTAPHERDAKIPGAVDEIINLASALNTRILSNQRDKIIALVKEKQNGYKIAYSYLKIASVSQSLIDNIYEENLNISDIKNEAESLCSSIAEENEQKIFTRLISSFGRRGKYTPQDFLPNDIERISISGSMTSSRIFLENFLSILKAKKHCIVRFPCPLNPAHTEAIYLPNQRILIARGKDGIDADRLIQLSLLHKEEIKTAAIVHSEALIEAQRWFSIAADIHFRLEEIYGEAMDFSQNDKILNKKITEIENIIENI